jgi:hypothetical protein
MKDESHPPFVPPQAGGKWSVIRLLPIGNVPKNLVQMTQLPPESADKDSEPLCPTTRDTGHARNHFNRR